MKEIILQTHNKFFKCKEWSRLQASDLSIIKKIQDIRPHCFRFFAASLLLILAIYVLCICLVMTYLCFWSYTTLWHNDSWPFIGQYEALLASHWSLEATIDIVTELHDTRRRPLHFLLPRFRGEVHHRIFSKQNFRDQLSSECGWVQGKAYLRQDCYCVKLFTIQVCMCEIWIYPNHPSHS